MQLTSDDLKELSQFALTAAKRAGEIISHFLKMEVDVKNKVAGESLASQVVTEVDILSQNVILKTLEPTMKKYDLALLTEEFPDDGSRLIKDYFWCIDPLDGTLPFIEKNPGFSVSIALVNKKGKPIIGVVYDPLHQNTYHAISGMGAYKNQTPWVIHKNKSDFSTPFTLITDRSFMAHPSYKRVLVALKSVANQLGYDPLDTIQHGGAVMNAIWVLENNPACYFKFPKAKPGGGSIWDFAATACLFNELGAKASDINGKPLDLNRPYSTFMNHRGIIYTNNKEIQKSIIHVYNAFQESDNQ